jgi:hypothetical protein
VFLLLLGVFGEATASRGRQDNQEKEVAGIDKLKGLREAVICRKELREA